MPFKKPNGDGYFTSEGLTDIEHLDGDLAYTYAPGSLDVLIQPLHGGLQAPTPPLGVVHVSDITRADRAGSFVIRTYA